MLAGERRPVGDELRWGALEDHLAAVMAGAGADVDDPVGVRHHRLVVLDHDHRLAGVDEAVEQAEQILHVGQMQAGGRLVEHVDAALLSHLHRELEALALTAREGRQRLSEAHVAEADVGEAVQNGMGGRHVGVTAAEELLGLRDGHREHLGDVFATEEVLEHLRLKALGVAVVAGAGDGVHEAEFGVDHAGALAGWAGALGVRGEERRLHAVGLRERLADRLEHAGVGGWVAAARAFDGALINGDHAVAARHRAADERALARARHAGDHGEQAEREVDVDILEVVGAGAADLEFARRLADRVLQRGTVVEMATRQRVAGPQPLDRALEHDLASGLAGAGAQIDDAVGNGHRLRLVLDHQHGVALVAQSQEQLVHAFDVVRVQADGWLVEHVGHVRQ